MTAILYPDCISTSVNGRFTLEARSPHNGTIPHRDGRKVSHEEFAFKYREHQSEFRYQLFDNAPRFSMWELFSANNRRLLWERWQGKEEDSPGELIVSDDGWSILRTHGFCPELIAVSPSGKDVVRVHITGLGSEHRTVPRKDGVPCFVWSPDILGVSTAGLYWSEHSRRYFFQYGGLPHFVWRTSWGQRLVIDLATPCIRDPSPEMEHALDEAEKHGVYSLLADLSSQMHEVRVLLSKKEGDEVKPHPLQERLRQVTTALHLTGVHRLFGCIPFLRHWESIDLPSRCQGSSAMPGKWWRESQVFRPIVHHSLRLLGEEPSGYPTYHFVTFEDNSRPRYSMPERLPDRTFQRTQVNKEMSAEEILDLLGSPDFIRTRFIPLENRLFQPMEDWEYDFRLGGTWATLRITWEEHREVGRIVGIEEVGPYWLVSNERENEILRW